MKFGRAALLGLTASDCDSAYPRCPRDETQLLYYLNNHRGGFFRFFNGGNSFGDDNFLQPQLQQQQQQQAASQGLNLLALQALAETLNGNSGSGFNLNNLIGGGGSNSPIALQQQQQQHQQHYQGLQAAESQSSFSGLLNMLKPSTLTDVVSNLLTGVVGNRFSRKLSKRSINDEHKIQKRIVNLKDNNDGDVVFAISDNVPYHQQQKKNSLFDELNEKPFTFSNQHRQTSYAVAFPHEIKNTNNNSFVSSADVVRRLKTLFPDVENFSAKFHQNLMRLLLENDQITKLITDGQSIQYLQNQQNLQQQELSKLQSSIISNDNKKYLSKYSVHRYPATSHYTGSLSNYNNKYNNNKDRSHIVYVTNGQGQIEYTLNELTGEKTKYL